MNSVMPCVFAAREAYLVEDQILEAPCETEALFPSHGGNIHTFKAITDCAVLDILTPPYDAKKGRHCTYYREVYSPTSNYLGFFFSENANAYIVNNVIFPLKQARVTVQNRQLMTLTERLLSLLYTVLLLTLQ